MISAPMADDGDLQATRREAAKVDFYRWDDAVANDLDMRTHYAHRAETAAGV